MIPMFVISSCLYQSARYGTCNWNAMAVSLPKSKIDIYISLELKCVNKYSRVTIVTSP